MTLSDVVTAAWPGIRSEVRYSSPHADYAVEIVRAVREFVSEEPCDLRNFIHKQLDPDNVIDGDGCLESDGGGGDDEGAPYHYPHELITEELTALRAIHDEVYLDAVAKMYDVYVAADEKIKERACQVLERAQERVRATILEDLKARADERLRSVRERHVRELERVKRRGAELREKHERLKRNRNEGGEKEGRSTEGETECDKGTKEKEDSEVGRRRDVVNDGA